MQLSKDRLIFDPANASDTDSIGSYLRSSDGTLITHTNVSGKDALDVYVANAADIEVALNAEYAEDSAHSSGEEGAYVLSVREDSLASSTSATGDYQSFKTDSLGRLWSNVDRARMSDGGTSGAYGAVSVTNAATAIPASPLAERKQILIENLNNSKPIYIGFDNAVTASNGIRVSGGGSITLEAGPGISIHGIASSGTVDVRVAELA